METFTLVIMWSVGSWWAGSTPQEHRTPGFTESECKRMAAGVVKPKQAKCVRGDASEEDRKYPVICPYLPPCWRNGRPLDAAGNPLPYEQAEALIKSRTGD